MQVSITGFTTIGTTDLIATVKIITSLTMSLMIILGIYLLVFGIVIHTHMQLSIMQIMDHTYLVANGSTSMYQSVTMFG